jgi:hypothetical protein
MMAAVAVPPGEIPALVGLDQIAGGIEERELGRHEDARHAEGDERGPTARMRTVSGEPGPMTKPAIMMSAPVPTDPRVERLKSLGDLRAQRRCAEGQEGGAPARGRRRRGSRERA